MNTSSQLLLRVAVLVGSVTLIAGLAGLVMLALRPDIPLPTAGANAPPKLHIRGRDAEQADRVEVHWTEGDAQITQEAVRGETRGVWVLPPVPEGQAVTLRIRRKDDGRVIHEVDFDDGFPHPVDVVVGAAAKDSESRD